MTVTAVVRTDAKAGYCSRCRNGQHSLCASPEGRCGCPYKDHPNRPDGIPVSVSPAAAAGASPLDDVRARAQASTPPAAAPTTPSPAETLCGYCRGRNHARCTSATCSCAGPAHPQRDRVPATKPQQLQGPVWQLVKADPPAPPPKPQKLTVVERARPFVEELVAEGDRDWHRFAVFPSTMGASQTVGRLRKAYSEMEFRSSRVVEVGQSAVYGRWLGEAPRGQL